MLPVTRALNPVAPGNCQNHMCLSFYTSSLMTYIKTTVFHPSKHVLFLALANLALPLISVYLYILYSRNRKDFDFPSFDPFSPNDGLSSRPFRFSSLDTFFLHYACNNAEVDMHQWKMIYHLALFYFALLSPFLSCKCLFFFKFVAFMVYVCIFILFIAASLFPRSLISIKIYEQG